VRINAATIETRFFEKILNPLPLPDTDVSKVKHWLTRSRDAATPGQRHRATVTVSLLPSKEQRTF
jgi:hypothetical protein